MATSTPDAVAHHDSGSGDRAGRIELHGIDRIPDEERHGRARELFAVWAAPNTAFLSIVVGAAPVLLGLNLWQALVAIVVGNLFSFFMGAVAVTGPVSGVPSQVTMRAMFGVRGNRVNIAITGWFVCVAYLAINWAAASVTAFSFVGQMGITVTIAVQAMVIVVIAAVTLAISVYGHATIVKLYSPLVVVLAVVFGVFAYFVLSQGQWAGSGTSTLHGLEFWAAMTASIGIVASAPLSYNNTSDLARYLPRTTSPAAVATWTALGAMVPSLILCPLGALAAASVDMSDPEAGLESFLPAWFIPVFQIAVIVGTISNNAITAYSSGLTLQSIGVRLPRYVTVLMDGVVATALTFYALLVSGFLESVNNMMQLIIALTGPVMAIYLSDIVLRRNRYDGAELSDESPSSPFWYANGVNWAGIVAMVSGAAATLLFVNAAIFTGPGATAIGGVDVSLPAGMLTAAAVYVVAMRRTKTPSIVK